MQKKLLKLGWFVLTIILLFSSFTFAEHDREKELILAGMLNQALDYWHYQSPVLNDRLSKEIFDQYIKNLDPNKRFFLQSDIEELKRYQYLLDEQLDIGVTEFMETATSVLEQRIRMVQAMLPDLLSDPFDYSKPESLETDPDKLVFSPDEGALKDLWQKLLKARTLEVYMDLLEKNASGKITAEKIDVKLESKARQNVLNTMKSSFMRMLQESREDKLVVYLNSVMACYDPHTVYFPPQQKEDFDISMSGKLEGIGAMLTVEGEYVKVEQIVPGSASWRQKDLKAGDLILKVGEAGDDPVDVANMPLNDVVRLIRGKKGTEVRLTVKKPNGQVLVIPIVRDVVVIEEAYARSAVISNKKSGNKFGYISLPSFYRDFNSKEARSSALDVRKELQKLNQEKVKGIILDLRNNSGGALDDAVEMTGLFIKDGPVVQTRDKTGKIQIYTDTDATIVSDAPMVVLVNSLSASASEILAAALQDYGRAVIVGSPHTFGKGTVQSLIDLDYLLSDDFAQYKPMGSLKMTTQKYYRINGGSVQFRGVKSDIELPDPYGYLEIGEEHSDHALSWDTISPLRYQKWKGAPFDLEILRQRSVERLKSNEAFNVVNTVITQIKTESNRTKQSLNLAEALKERTQRKAQATRLNEAQHHPTQVKVTTSLPKNDQIETWLKQVGEDIYIEEASNILSDIIAQQ